MLAAWLFTLSSPVLAETLSVADAKAHVTAGRVDEIFLAWSALQPGVHPEGDRRVSKVLVSAASASLRANDAAVSMSLSKAALRLHPGLTPAALVFARAAISLDQTGAAASVLDTALLHAPRNPRLLHTRATLAQQEGDLELAHQLYRRVPRRGPAGRRARKAAVRVKKTIDAQARQLAAASRREKRLRAKIARAAAKADERSAAIVPTTRNETGVAGMASRESAHFRIVYGAGRRDFAARARYEAKALAMFERAYDKVGVLTGYRPRKRFEVVLYTQAEFELHFGNASGGQLLGFYAGKIRMNLADDLNDSFFHTVVHEYTHAVLDDLTGGQGGRLATWFNEGFAEWAEWEIAREGDRGIRKSKGMRPRRRRATGLPLAAIENRPFRTLGPATDAAYLKGRAAMSVLIGTGSGLPKVREVCEAVKEGTAFRTALREAFGETVVNRLEADTNALLLER